MINLIELDKMIPQNFIDAVELFITKYKRLPYNKEDNLDIVELVDNEEVIRVLRAKGQISQYFTNFDDFIQYLFKKSIISYDLIAKMTKNDAKSIKKIVEKSIKTPDNRVRRSVEMFMGIDYCKEIDDGIFKKCSSCKYNCKQFYFVDLISCKMYKKK